MANLKTIVEKANMSIAQNNYIYRFRDDKIAGIRGFIINPETKRAGTQS